MLGPGRGGLPLADPLIAAPARAVPRMNGIVDKPGAAQPAGHERHTGTHGGVVDPELPHPEAECRSRRR
jgi:hypothetical protein